VGMLSDDTESRSLEHLTNNVILSPVDSAGDRGVILEKYMSFAQHISSISKSFFQKNS